MPDSAIPKPVDPFHIEEIASVQAGLLASLAVDPIDISIKIAALRATADLLQQSVGMTVLAQQVAVALQPPRKP
jgi:hypothetical protein